MAEPLQQAKATRDAAQSAFQAKLADVREDFTVRSLGGRVADRVTEAAAQTAEVISEHKIVAAGTIAALAAWFLRRPIVRLIRRWTGDDAA